MNDPHKIVDDLEDLVLTDTDGNYVTHDDPRLFTITPRDHVRMALVTDTLDADFVNYLHQNDYAVKILTRNDLANDLSRNEAEFFDAYSSGQENPLPLGRGVNRRRWDRVADLTRNNYGLHTVGPGKHLSYKANVRYGMKRALRQNLKGLTAKEYEALRILTRLSKNLYNSTLYEVRQHFFNNGEYLNYYDAYPRLKQNENYEALNSQMAQQTMKRVDEAFKSFFKLVEKKRQNKYNQRISIPHYLPKDGYFLLDYPNQAFQIKDDHLRIGVPKQVREQFGIDITEIQIPFTYDDVRKKDLKRLQILPKGQNCDYFEYRVVYEEEQELIETRDGSWLAVDLGVSNLATCMDDRGHTFIVCGKKLKSQNRWFNKKLARLQSVKDKQGIKGNTARINRLYRKRNNKVHDYLDKTVREIVDHCIENNIETVYVGDGKGWKQGCNLGDRNNQNFVQIPFDKLKQKLKHKLKHHGIEYELVNEAYTSKCSFLDNEPVQKHPEDKYAGKRVHRGLFRGSDGTEINGDVNGAGNIARKGTGKPNPSLFTDEEEGLESAVTAPKRIRVQ